MEKVSTQKPIVTENTEEEKTNRMEYGEPSTAAWRSASPGTAQSSARRTLSSRPSRPASRSLEFLKDFARKNPCDDALTAAQLRALWTAYVLPTGLKSNTYSYDKVLMTVWDCCKSASGGDAPRYWHDFNEFARYMVELLQNRGGTGCLNSEGTVSISLLDQQRELEYLKDFAQGNPCDAAMAAQLRAIWTAYVLHADLEPDTCLYDKTLTDVWDCCRSASGDDGPRFWCEFNEFDLYMAEDLC